MSEKAKVLCLHGYAQNGDFFRQRTGALRKALKAVAEFTFVDAPHPATAEFLGEVGEDRGAALGWFNVGETAPGARPAISRTYIGMEAALERVRTVYETDGPFDAVLGFSQGATLAAYCCLHPEAWLPTSRSSQPFRFAMIFSAFTPRDPAWSLGVGELSLLRPPAQLPTFHCYGVCDDRVPHASSRAVAANFVAPVEHEHGGGHGVPSDAALRAALKSFIEGAMRDAPAVAAAGSAGGTEDAGAARQAGPDVVTLTILAAPSDRVSLTICAARQ